MGGDLRLRGKRVLVVEDEFFIADDLARDFAAMGAEIVGPAATLEQARQLLDERPIDMAVLDIKLRDAVSYPVADELVARRVPVVFATGFDADVIPARFAGVPRCVKPASSGTVAALLATTFDRPSGSRPKRWPRPRFMDRRAWPQRQRIAVRPSAT